jgi:hypothetical protein
MTPEQLLELADLHARVEGQMNLDALMATLVAEPVYEFPIQRLTLRGGANVRRYYAQFFEDFMTRVSGNEVLGLWGGHDTVAREDAIEFKTPSGPEVHHVMSVFFTDGHKLGGERIYADDFVVQAMAGSMYGELEPLR